MMRLGAKDDNGQFWTSMGSVVFMFSLWVLVTETGLANPLFLPGPVAIYDAFIDCLFEGYQGSTLIEHVGTSLYRILAAFLLACLIGIPLGTGFNARNAGALGCGPDGHS